MMMPAWLLGPRRIWWFLTDWRTPIRFLWACPGCKWTTAREGRGFRPERRFSDHDNPICKYNKFYEHARTVPFRMYCWICVRNRVTDYRFWLVWRWRFRLRYNWGVGVPHECLHGNHDFGEKPAGVYTKDGAVFVIGKCKREGCGFAHRWEILDKEEAAAWARVASTPT